MSRKEAEPRFDAAVLADYSTSSLRSGAAHARSRAERVFSLVEAITGPDQVRMLADQLQAGAMLRYNKRMVG